ncbi:MAG: ATP-grasp domain-containing protein, partial [Halanaerobium sp.]
NKQLINKENFSYQGGIINYQFKNTKKLKKVVEQIKERYPGLNGYFGIDFIYNNGKYDFLEINPRFTSSIIGIAELYNFFNLIIAEKRKNTDNKLKTPAEFNNQNFEFKIK